jgi:hypothetical protein
VIQLQNKPHRRLGCIGLFVGAIMTVKELIERLKSLPPDMPVVMAADPEGNSFDNCEDVGKSWFDENMDHCDITDIEDDDEWEEYVVLWP